jgi:hypothetical protein
VAIFTFISQLFVKWRLFRNARVVWDDFLRQNQSSRLNEITAHSSISLGLHVHRSRMERRREGCINSSTCRDVTPCSVLKVNRRFEGIFRLNLRAKEYAKSKALLATYFRMVACLAYSSNLKIDATFSSETSVESQRTTRRYIPEHKTLHNRRCESLRSCKDCISFTGSLLL